MRVVIVKDPESRPVDVLIDEPESTGKLEKQYKAMGYSVVEGFLVNTDGPFTTSVEQPRLASVIDHCLIRYSSPKDMAKHLLSLFSISEKR